MAICNWCHKLAERLSVVKVTFLLKIRSDFFTRSLQEDVSRFQGNYLEGGGEDSLLALAISTNCTLSSQKKLTEICIHKVNHIFCMYLSK